LPEDCDAAWLEEQMAADPELAAPRPPAEVAERSIARVRAWILFRELLHFATLGFLYSRRERSSREDPDEDPDR